MADNWAHPPHDVVFSEIFSTVLRLGRGMGDEEGGGLPRLTPTQPGGCRGACLAPALDKLMQAAAAVRYTGVATRSPPLPDPREGTTEADVHRRALIAFLPCLRATVQLKWRMVRITDDLQCLRVQQHVLHRLSMGAALRVNALDLIRDLMLQDREQDSASRLLTREEIALWVAALGAGKPINGPVCSSGLAWLLEFVGVAVQALEAELALAPHVAAVAEAAEGVLLAVGLEQAEQGGERERERGTLGQPWEEGSGGLGSRARSLTFDIGLRLWWAKMLRQPGQRHVLPTPGGLEELVGLLWAVAARNMVVAHHTEAAGERMKTVAAKTGRLRLPADLPRIAVIRCR